MASKDEFEENLKRLKELQAMLQNQKEISDTFDSIKKRKQIDDIFNEGKNNG